MLVKVIVDVDDFGMLEVINYGIIKSYVDGLMMLIFLMFNLLIVEYVVVLVKNYLGLFVG